MLRAAAIALLLACGAASAEQPRIRFGLQGDIAPFVMPNRDSGLLVDMLRESLATQGIVAEFAYVPASRAAESLRSGWIDASTSGKPTMPLPGVMTNWPVTSFHNMAITLKSRIPKLAIADLSRYRVTAFMGAKRMLGPAYSAAVENNRYYREPTTLQSPLLVAGQVDILISQRDIFNYYLSRQSYLREGEQEVAYHDILGHPNEYWFVFRTIEQRDAFEKGIAAYYKSGGMDQLIERYHKQYGTSRDFLRPLDCQFAASKPKLC